MGRGLSSHARTILNLNQDVSAWSHQVMIIVLHSISQRHFTGRSNLSHFSKALSFTAQSRAHLLTLKADQNGGLGVQGWFSNTGSQTSRHAHQMKFSQGQKRSMTYNKRSKLASWCRLWLQLLWSLRQVGPTFKAYLGYKVQILGASTAKAQWRNSLPVRCKAPAFILWEPTKMPTCGLFLSWLKVRESEFTLLSKAA